MVRSQRSSNALFHQWSTTTNDTQERQPSTPSHPPYTHTSSHGTSVSFTTNGKHTGDGQALGSRHGYHFGSLSGKSGIPRTPGPSAPALAAPTEPVPGSPSQIDPFGSQVTSPTPMQYPSYTGNSVNTIHTHSHAYGNSTTPGTGNGTGTCTLSRPPSTILSAGSPSVGVVTPRIILASPSTSTIHYLFPSSDTKTHLDVSSTGTASTTGTGSSTNPSAHSYSHSQNPRQGEGVKRNHSVAKREKKRTSIVRTDQITVHRETAGITNKRALPTPASAQPQHHAQLSNVLSPARKQSTVNPASATWGGWNGVRKSDISKPFPSLVDEGRDYSKGYYDVGPVSDPSSQYDAEMGTLRRQPGMVDLTGKGAGANTMGVGVKRRESIILKEIENGRERRGWEIGSKPIYSTELVNSSNEKSRGFATASSRSPREKQARPYIPPITIIQQRRRSQSLTSPRPAPSPPIDGKVSPLLPAPDLGDPLSLSVVIPSPSYSHLDYSPAGSSASTFNSRESKSWGKRTSSIFPISSAMSRGDTRKGLGGYDAGKIKAREDAERRLNANSDAPSWTSESSSANSRSGSGGRFASLRRSVSLRKKEDESRKPRPRSQSVGARSPKLPADAPPLPTRVRPLGSTADKNAEATAHNEFVGSLSIDLGSRYVKSVFSPRDTPSTAFASPGSADTSIFPASTPTSDCHSAIIENVIRIVGKPLHPAFNDSDFSILAPSTIGLGFSPDGTPDSLPASLKAEVIDLTETGRRLVSSRGSNTGSAIITPPTLQRAQEAYPPESSAEGSASSSSHESQTSGEKETKCQKGRIPRRSLLLAQNRFFLPPTHPKPSTSLQKKASLSLRSSKSLGPGLMKAAYTSGNLNLDSKATMGGGAPDDPTSATTASFGSRLLKSASIRSTTRRVSRVAVIELDDRPNYDATPAHAQRSDRSRDGDGDRAQELERKRDPPRLRTTPSMRFGSGNGHGGRRPMTTFSICSPSDAIEPLPCASPQPGLSEHSDNHSAHVNARPHSTLRSNRSSPFLSASQSLRVIFGKEGFVARSLSQAFDRNHGERDNDRSQPSGPGLSSGLGDMADGKDRLKSRISSPLEANPKARGSLSARSNATRTRDRAKEDGRSADRAWRESVLQEAVSLSITSGLNNLASGSGAPTASSKRHSRRGEDDPEHQQRMVSSGSKSRLAIPDILLAAPHITEHTISVENATGGRETMFSEPDWSGLGESMIRPSKGSIESGLSLRAVVEDCAEPSRNRALGQVGKEESMMSAPSMYSNRASNFVERPSRKLQGRGFPSSFSIADLKSKYRNPSPSNVESSSSAGQGKPGLRSRIISPPMPFSSPLAVPSQTRLDDRSDFYDSGSMEELRENALLPSPPIVEKCGRATEMSRSSSRSGLFRITNPHSSSNTAKSPQPGSNGETNPGSGPGSSSFGLGLSQRSSLRSKSSKAKWAKPAQGNGAGVGVGNVAGGMSSTGNGVGRTPSYSKHEGISSEDLPISQPLLDALIAREEFDDESSPKARTQTQPQSQSAAKSKLEMVARLGLGQEAKERDKVRKVMEWRDEVGENEGLARLEERMRGFVVGERERILGIARRSEDGE